MDPKTFFILLAIGAAGISWSYVRQTEWYKKAGDRLLVAFGFVDNSVKQEDK